MIHIGQISKGDIIVLENEGLISRGRFRSPRRGNMYRVHFVSENTNRLDYSLSVRVLDIDFGDAIWLSKHELSAFRFATDKEKAEIKIGEL